MFRRTVRALRARLPRNPPYTLEEFARLVKREAGSFSRLSLFRDGLLVRDRESLCDRLDTARPGLIRGSLERAERATRGELLLFGRHVPFRGGKAWRTDPVQGGRWPLLRSEYIRYNRKPGRRADIRRVWELSRLGVAFDLALADAARPDRGYRGALARLIEDWTAHNPYGRGPNWAVAMETALRGTALVFAMELLGAKWSLPFLHTLYCHLLWTRQNHECAKELPTNHCIAGLSGLVVMGRALDPLPAAAQAVRTAASMLSGQVLLQFDEEGAYYEGATGYGAFALEAAVTAHWLCALSPEAVVRLKAAAAHLARLVRPDGSVPLFGDYDGSRLLPLDGGDWRGVLRLAERALGGGLPGSAETAMSALLVGDG